MKMDRPLMQINSTCCLIVSYCIKINSRFKWMNIAMQEKVHNMKEVGEVNWYKNVITVCQLLNL